MTLTGGLRDRMLLESYLQAIVADLQTKGWFDAGREHGDIQVVDEFPDDDQEVPINTLAFSYGDSFQLQVELGSRAEEHYSFMYVDFFAESDALGRHVIGDIYAFLAENPSIPVYDYDQATPSIEFYGVLEQESLEKRRPSRVVNPWQKHWHILVWRVLDMRANA